MITLVSRLGIGTSNGYSIFLAILDASTVEEAWECVIAGLRIHTPLLAIERYGVEDQRLC